MAGEVHQAAVDGCLPPGVGPPALADHAGAIEDGARLGRGDHEARDVELLLPARMFGREVAQGVEDAALRSGRRMGKIETVEVRAAVARERDQLAVQLR